MNLAAKTMSHVLQDKLFSALGAKKYFASKETRAELDDILYKYCNEICKKLPLDNFKQNVTDTHAALPIEKIQCETDLPYTTVALMFSHAENY